MTKRITATHAAKKLREVLNEVELNGETFEVDRYGKLIAEIRPVEPVKRFTWKDFWEWKEQFPLDPDFAKDVEEARRIDAQFPDEDPWERSSKPPIS